VTVIEFPPPTVKPLSMNDRAHPKARARLVKRWRTQTRIFALEQLTGITLGPSIVQVEIPVVGTARRDPHNYFATVKPIVDGLVDAGAWPDDTPEHVTTVEPTLRVYPRADACRRLVRVTLTPRSTP
jgi:crossover junction endodeoxyribonuclease RusA